MPDLKHHPPENYDEYLANLSSELELDLTPVVPPE